MSNKFKKSSETTINHLKLALSHYRITCSYNSSYKSLIFQQKNTYRPQKLYNNV